MVEKKKNTYLELPIENSMLFTKLTNFNKVGACSLQEIDLYTAMFNDEEELRNTLYKEGLISSELFNKSLSIRSIKNGVSKKVPYDFLYQKDIEYIVNPNKLITSINERNFANDFHFLKSLAEKFQNFYDCNVTASELKHYANNSLNTGIRSPFLDELDRQGDNLVVRFLKLLIFKYYQKPNGQIIYYDTVKYANLHHLIAYVNNYNSKHQEEKEKDQFSLFEEIKPPVKRKIKEKTVIDGQFSMFE